MGRAQRRGQAAGEVTMYYERVWMVECLITFFVVSAALIEVHERRRR